MILIVVVSYVKEQEETCVVIRIKFSNTSINFNEKCMCLNSIYQYSEKISILLTIAYEITIRILLTNFVVHSIAIYAISY